MNRITNLATLRRAAAATAAAASITQSRSIHQATSSPFARLNQRLPNRLGSAPNSNGITAGTMFFSIAAASSLTQEAHAKEPLQSNNIKDVVLYQYEACPFCNKVKGVLGDGFMASGLTIQNTAGPDAHQAVAFRSDSDFSYIENCEFLGNQDTVYVHALRQFFKSCRIEGNVDFIFGNAAAIFQDCTILVRPRQTKPASGETNAISAYGRTDPAQTTWFAFLGCTSMEPTSI